ncbi:serine hydroxymethyltransferase [Streptomyces sp. M41]|uniref:serine hydroxymethyltransferase n=1 Tax=Streptomyces sp. M41 TaxID=3059412 RepID=UPI00374CF62A
MSQTYDIQLAGARELPDQDPELATLLDQELDYETGVLAMVAHASVAPPSVLAAAGTVLSNVTAEGYPGRRYHPGAEWFDAIERLAVSRAQAAFGARYANVQPHSCTAANLAVEFGLLAPGATLLGLHLDAGGHLTHGAPASVTGRAFHSVSYGLDDAGLIDYDRAAELARAHRPGLIVAGASAHPRRIDYQRFRDIADEVGAYLLADISHIAGLVAAGVLPSPVDIAHVTTTSTYKQLGGPRGGLILMGAEHATLGPDGRTPLSTLIDRAVFPLTQGTPNAAAIAAKARALDVVATPGFKATAHRIAADATALADALIARDWPVLTGGTDNHMVLLDVSRRGLTGAIAELALSDCGILANRNRIPGDTRPPLVAGGLRLGTNILAQRGMEPADMTTCAELVVRVLDAVEPVSDTEYRLDPDVRKGVLDEVADLCRCFPIPGYPQTTP